MSAFLLTPFSLETVSQIAAVALLVIALLSLSSSITQELAARHLWLPDSARSMGIHIQAGKGSGKSRLMGRIIAWLDFVRGFPLVIFDPHGPTIDNFLDKIIRLPQHLREQFWPRVLYVDMSGRDGHVIPFPLYYRLGGESLYEISQRYLDVVRKIDPNLQTASIEGWNPLWLTGTHIGMTLAALGFQITEADSLLRNPLTWEGRLRQALTLYPEELQPTLAFCQELAEATDNERNRATRSFFNKTGMFNFDLAMKGMFGAGTLGVDWKQVMNQRLAVLLDFRHVHNIEHRRFKMIWSFNYFLDFIKHRGYGRHLPVGLIIDELTSLFSVQSLNSDLFGSELDELINVLARNYRVWLTIGHQELFQVTDRVRNSLMTMGTQILGVTSDPAAAEYYAHLFDRYDPHLVKKYEPVYASVEGCPALIDHTSVEYTAEEQRLLKSYQFTGLGRFHFLVRPAPGEGDVTGSLLPISIAGFDADLYPNDELVTRARELLMKRLGRPVGEVLAEIEARLQPNQEMARLPMPTPEKGSVAEREIPSFWGE